VRLWLKDSERRPDPPVVHTDDRKPMLVGIIAWAVALGALLLFFGPVVGAGYYWWIPTCVVGIVFGLVGLVYLQRRGRVER
jgi:peptidoglycan/LPS O-acetylase OafA/YrhL